MITQLKQQLDKKSISLWRLHATLYLLVAMICSIAFICIDKFFELIDDDIMSPIVIILSVWCGFIVIWHIAIYPVWRYKNWRYEVSVHDISIKKGIIFHTREVVPLVRVQNVVSHQGPLMRLFKLSSVHISTAGTDLEIPCLTNEEAARLREKIAVLARVSREDV